MAEESYVQSTMNLWIATTWVKVIELFKYNKHTRVTSQYFYFVLYNLMPYMFILSVIVITFTLLEFINLPH